MLAGLTSHEVKTKALNTYGHLVISGGLDRESLTFGGEQIAAAWLTLGGLAGGHLG